MMKHIARALAVACLVVLVALPLFAQSYRPRTCLGTQVINPATSTALTVPAGTQHVVFSVRSAGVHVDFEGATATTSDVYFPAGVYEWSNESGSTGVIAKMRFIDSSDGASTVYVAYFGAR